MEERNERILHKEIDLIQDCIKRMAHNSFLIKGWSITLIAVVLALTKDKVDFLFISIILLLPILGFWYLDTFFLHTEKMYRAMYEWVIKNRLKSDERLYELNPRKYEDSVDRFSKVFFSITLRIFYGIPALVLLIIIVLKTIQKFSLC
jgi:hypothetical protein